MAAVRPDTVFPSVASVFVFRECLNAPTVSYQEHQVVLRKCRVRAGRPARNTLDDEATHVIYDERNLSAR